MAYKDPIERPDPQLVQQLQTLRQTDPAISVTELAKRTGKSRKTIHRYLNDLRRQAAEDAASNAGQAQIAIDAQRAEQKAVRVNGELSVLEKTNEVIRDFDRRIAALDKQRNRLKAEALIIRARTAQERYLRLRAELEREIAPPGGNTYVEQIQVLMQSIGNASPWVLEGDGGSLG